MSHCLAIKKHTHTTNKRQEGRHRLRAGVTNKICCIISFQSDGLARGFLYQDRTSGFLKEVKEMERGAILSPPRELRSRGPGEADKPLLSAPNSGQAEPRLFSVLGSCCCY